MYICKYNITIVKLLQYSVTSSGVSHRYTLSWSHWLPQSHLQARESVNLFFHRAPRSPRDECVLCIIYNIYLCSTWMQKSTMNDKALNPSSRVSLRWWCILRRILFYLYRSRTDITRQWTRYAKDYGYYCCLAIVKRTLNFSYTISFIFSLDSPYLADGVWEKSSDDERTDSGDSVESTIIKTAKGHNDIYGQNKDQVSS